MKRLLLIFALICLASYGWAEQITREQALRQAQQFCDQNGKRGPLTMPETAMSKARRRSQQVPDYYYVFNVGQDQGYVIVSGDDRTEPILGYSNNGTFDVDNIPYNMAGWLQGYADQIKYIQEHNIQPLQRRAVPTHAVIPDMITTKWDQDSPYNDLLPTHNSKTCVTGCVTTAMAQIMNYHRSPAACTAIPGYTTETHKIVCENLPATSFNWDNMNNNAEVSKLMKYCAYALQADFDPSGTQVWDDKPAMALVNYFGYGKGIQLSKRDLYTDEDWDMLIYNELANGRPVLYGGQADEGGHSFIIHGYSIIDGVGYYSVNWGWGGRQDGSYLLDAMTPSKGGIGSGDTTGNGYNFKQSALVGISTSDVTPYQVEETVVLTTEYIKLPEGDNTYTIPAGRSQFGPIIFYAMYISKLTRSYNIQYNYKIYKDGEFLEYLERNPSTFNFFGSGYYFPYSNDPDHPDITGFYLPNWDGYSLGNSFRKPGTYKIVPVSREEGTIEWHENIGSDKYYLTGIVSSDMKLKMYVGDPTGTNPTPEPEVTQAELDELNALYVAQKTAISDKIAALTSIDTKLTAIAQLLSQKNDELNAVNTKMIALEEKLMSDYLTAEQKQDYNNQLDVLKAQSAVQVSSINDAVEKLYALQSENASLKATLNSLLNSVNTEAAAVASITTKAALDASKASVAEITTQQSSCDLSAETTNIAALEALAANISLTDIQTALVNLESNIDADVEAAEQAEKLAKAQEAFETAIQTLDDTIESQEADYEKCMNVLNVLKVKLSDIDNAISQMKVEYTEIEKKLQELIDMQSDTRTDNWEIVENLKKRLETLNSNIITLESQRDLISGQIDKLDQQAQSYSAVIEECKASRLKLQNELANATTADEVEKLTASVAKAKSDLSSNGTEWYNLLVDNCNIIIDNVYVVVDNVNIVDNQIQALKKEVETALTSISQPMIDESEVFARYDMKGNRVDSTYKGVQIIRLKNGKIIKLNVK